LITSLGLAVDGFNAVGSIVAGFGSLSNRVGAPLSVRSTMHVCMISQPAAVAAILDGIAT
jgi:hypothetical protein